MTRNEQVSAAVGDIREAFRLLALDKMNVEQKWTGG